MKQFKMNERQRFSIRKFSIGAASVLLGSVFFVANPATEVQAAEANTEVVSQDGNGNTGNSSVLPPSDTSSQNPSIGQAGTEAETQGREKKEPGTPSKDSEGKAEETVENKGDEKVDGVVKPVSGESSPVSEVEKDKKEAQLELEEKSLTDKEEAVVADKTDQSQEEDGYQLYDKLIDASKRLKESNPESAADFKNLADTINEKLGLSDDGKISGELVEKAHKLLDGNQIDKAEIEGANNFKRRKRDTELTDVQIGRWNGTRKKFDSSTLFVNPGGLGLAGNNMQIKAISNSDPITDISVTGDDGLGLKKTKGGLNTKEATLSFTGNTPNKGSWILRVTVTTAKGTKTATFGYVTPTPTPTITTSADKLNGKSEDKPEVDVTLNETPNLTLPEGIKMKVYLIRGGGDSRDYGGAANGAYPYNYNILATAEVKSDGTAKITSNDYVVSKIGEGEVRAITVYELPNTGPDKDVGERGSFRSAPVTVTAKPTAPALDKAGATREVNDAVTTKKGQIDSDNGLTTEEKTEVKGLAETAKNSAITKINEAQTETDLNNAKTEGVRNIQNVALTGTTKKASAIAAIEAKVTEKTNQITQDSSLTEDEKTAEKNQVTQEAGKAKTAINQATTNANVETEKNKGITAIGAVTTANKTKASAIAAIEAKVTEKTNQITQDSSLTEDEKTAEKNQVTQEAGKAKTAINQATTNANVETEKNKGITAIGAVTTANKTKASAIAAIEAAAFAKKTEISNRFDLTTEDKSRALQQVDQEAKDAKIAVDKGVTNKDVEQAKVAGIDAIKNINPQPSPRPLPTPQPSTPTQPNQGATEIPTAPSEPAPQPSQPTAPSQPASPARSQSSAPTQAPRVAASPSASSTSTQAPAQEQVDKSELRALTQELDQRLKALATVSDSKIDAAKAVLLDAQKALEDSALTEQGLRTAVESVKAALDSLKDVKANASDSKPAQDKKDTKQGTEDSKDSDKMTETNSVPAGVIVVSLLALLGVIAFWLVRRKKESEIQQLSTELTKVLGQLDAEKADKKVLAKAKKLLQETLDFVKEENGSAETEAKLVEELKAILAKLK